MVLSQLTNDQIFKIIAGKIGKYYFNSHDMIVEIMQETGLEEWEVINIINELIK